MREGRKQEDKLLMMGLMGWKNKREREGKGWKHDQHKLYACTSRPDEVHGSVLKTHTTERK